MLLGRNLAGKSRDFVQSHLAAFVMEISILVVCAYTDGLLYLNPVVTHNVFFKRFSNMLFLRV